MIALAFVLVLLVGLVIASTTFQPLGRIVTAIEEPAAPSAKGTQEVERVIQSVYDLKESNTAMQSRLNEQLHEFSLEQVRALQHQIDPHFSIACERIIQSKVLIYRRFRLVLRGILLKSTLLELKILMR